MSRNITSTSRAALYAAETGEAFLILLTLSHAGLAAPLRVSSNSTDTVSRGDTYIAYPFDITLPDDDEGHAPRARLVIDNIDRQIVATLRQIESAPTLRIEIVRAADPDTIEAVFDDFRLVNVVYDSQVVEGDLSIEDYTSEPYPAAVFSPSLFPGLF